MKQLPLVLLPGMDGTGFLFEPLVSALPSAVLPRAVGYPADEPSGYEALLPIVLDALPRDRDFVLLGESFSGPLALMAAATAPQGLRAVVLCASFIRAPVRWVPGALVAPLTFRMVPRFAQAVALMGWYTTPELRALLALAQAVENPRVMAARARAILDVDASEALRACAVPILYLRGRYDRLVSRRSLRAIAEASPTLRAVTIPAPHLVLQVQPAMSAHAICSFLASIGAF